MSEHKPVRILQVGMSPTYGGTEAFVMEQYRHIDRSAVQFDFLNVFSETLACQNEIESLGGKIYHLNLSRREGIRKYRTNLESFFLENHYRFQGVHCNYQSLINIDILAFAKKYQIPIRIAHAHNSGYGHEPNFVQKFLIWSNKRKIKNYATSFLACSDLAASWMFPRGVSVQVVHNAIDAGRFRFSSSIRNRKRASLGIPEDRLVLLFAGRLDPQKNPLFLIKVFRELSDRVPNSTLLMAGDGMMHHEIECAIQDNGLSEKVQLLGNRQDISELMQAADAFLLPSLFEGLGIVLVEAQAAGLPCFASKDVIPLAVNITGLVNFISLKESAERWARQIIGKLSEKLPREDKFEEICSAGYDSETNSQQLKEIYLRSMGGDKK